MHVPGPYCYPPPCDSTSSLCDLFCSQPWTHQHPCLFKPSSGCVASLSKIICQALSSSEKKPRPSHTKSWPTMPARKRPSSMGHLLQSERLLCFLQLGRSTLDLCSVYTQCLRCIRLHPNTLLSPTLPCLHP